MPSWPSATVSEDHGFRVWGAAISPDGRRAMTWVQHGMGRTGRVCHPVKEHSTRGGSKPTPGYRPMPPLPWCFPVTPIRLPVRSI
jgi:hypothetical protein